MSFFRQGRLSLFSILFTGIALIWTTFNISRWKGLDVIRYDVTQYYGYLPAAFIYKDLRFGFMDTLTWDYKHKIGAQHTDDGRRFLKMPVGTAFLYLPFFAVGHFHANLFDYPLTGYSQPYELWLCIGTVVYVLIGLLLLRSLLLKVFGDSISVLVILSIVFATNLFHYSTNESGMSHAYSFFLFALFLLCSIRWRESPSFLNSMLLGLTGGLIVMARVSNIIIFLIPLILGATSFRNQVILLSTRWKQILAISFMALLMLIPQFAYWKYATGHWLYYSYQHEGFFFTEPRIIEGLFSYRKGWLIYTPIMLFSLVGFFFMNKDSRIFRMPILIFTIINFYVVFSWGCWWYGGSFGMRALIESYALLALPLGAFYNACLKSKKGLALLLTLILAFTTLNLFQTWQYRKRIIHWDSMTKEAYWAVFGKKKAPPALNSLLKAPIDDRESRRNQP